MNSDKFRDMVFVVSQSLRSEESHDLAYLYQLPERYYHTRPIDVLMELEIEQYIHKNNPETLVTVLERIKRADLASKVKKMIKKYKKHDHVDLRMKQSTDRSCDDHVQQMLHFELALAKMQMEHTTHRINVLREHIQHWTSLNVSSDFKTAIDYCRQASISLTSIEKEIRTVTGTSSYCQTGGESSLSLDSSSCNSSVEDITSSYQTEKESWSATKSQGGGAAAEYKTEVRLRTGSIPLIGLTNKGAESLLQQTKLPQIIVASDRSSIASSSNTGDSGFVDVRPFLKEPSDLAVNTSGEDEGIYEEIRLTADNRFERSLIKTLPAIPTPKGNETNYMKINPRQVVFNEYMTTRRATYHTRSCLDKGHSSPELHKLQN